MNNVPRNCLTVNNDLVLVGVQCFHAFLKSEFSEENIDFWIACESYKNLKTSKQPAQAQKIFAEFIAHQAPREVSFPL